VGAVWRDVSDTALVTAAQRARESRRREPLFDDPYAGRLAGDRGRALARTVNARMIASRVIARTAVFDEWITRTVAEGTVDCILNLGAGLDARPYRLDLPPELRWVEADLAGVHEHKADVLDAVAPRCRLERHGVDLSDPASRRQLLDQVGTGPPTLVLTEGVLPYLAEADVAALATDLAAHPAFRWWVVDIVAPGFLTLTDRVAGRRLVAAGASLRFAPTQGPAFFARVGWDATEVRSSWLEQRPPRS
jgi:methyltransferase (TIGR00027 family)